MGEGGSPEDEGAGPVRGRSAEEPTETRPALRSLHGGRYLLLEQIGAGGMGIVYRGLDTELERPVALKRPLPEKLDNPHVRERFLREARAASRLHHPHVVQIFEVFEEEGVPWIAMELVPGRSLARVLSDRGKLPVEELLRHAVGLADALELAHSRQILHRDVNPDNVLIGDDGRARLTDFGIARAFGDQPVGSDPQPALTGQGLTMGTPYYMSPEQALGRPLDRRTDVFNLGLVVFEMATGRRAYRGRRSGEWIDALLHGDPPQIGDHRPDAPAELDRVVRRALARRRKNRYQDAASLRDDLSRLLETTRSGLRPAAGFGRRVLVRRAAFTAAAVLAAVAVAAIAWRLLRSPDPLADLSDWTPRRLTADPGWEAEPALSPDGTLVAYASDRAGNADVWVLDLLGGDPLQLTRDPASDRTPCWMHDGTAVLFVSDRSGTRSIWRVPRLGGSPVMVVEDAVDPAVSPDGTQIAFARVDASGFHRIFVAPIGDPGAARQLTGDDDGLWNHRGPDWSPDGERLCYFAHRNIYLISVRDGDVVPLTTDNQVDRQPSWGPDGRSILFSSMRQLPEEAYSFALWRIDVGSRVEQRLTFGSGPEVDPSIGPSQRRVAYAQERWDTRLVVVRRSDGRTAEMGTLEMENSPALAPDGSFIAYTAPWAGRPAVLLQRLDAGMPVGEPKVLAANGGAVTVVSPDGRWLAYHLVVDGRRDVWVLPVEGGPARRFTDDPAIDVNPHFSPDGTSIAFSSNRDGDARIWMAPFEHGRRVGPARKLTAGEGQDYHPAFSPDGRRLAWIRYEHGFEDVWVMDLSAPSSARQVTHGQLVYRLKWLPPPDGLVASGLWDGDRWVLRKLAVDDGSLSVFDPPTVLGPIEGGGLFDLTADGGLLGCITTDREGDIWLLEARSDQR